MLRYADYDIVFQEIPDEVTLAINLSNCPNHCKGCHSAYLMEDVGEPLTEENLTVKRPGTGISPMQWESVIGTEACRSFKKDDLIVLQ